MTKRPQITEGYIHTPDMWRGRGIMSYQERDYSDGLKVLVGSSPNGVIHLLAWDSAKGTNAGYLKGICNNPSDISAIVRTWRNQHKEQAS